MQQFEGAEEAQKAVEANTSPRYKRLEALERYVTGRQYDGLKSWWDDSVPLWERAPCIVYPVTQIAIQSNTDLVLGEGRYPSFSAKPGEDEAEDDSGTDEKSAEDIDRYLTEYHRLSRFKAHCRDAFSAAQGCGTAAAIHGARDGIPFANLIPAKWGTPDLGLHGEVLELEIRYPYLDEYKKPDGKWAVRAKLYRRVITTTQDITFLPADADRNGMEPVWRQDPERTLSHSFGFCPVIWYPFMKGCQPVNVIDGQAIQANLTDEIRQHDIAISQRHRGALFSEPQDVEIGVDPGYNPTALGRTPAIVSTEKGGAAGPGNPVTGGYGSGTGQPARKKGPGYVWQYPNPDTKVQRLVYPGDALKAQDDNARDLRVKLMQSLAVVILDHESVQGIRQLSGKALEAIKQMQLDRCDQFRDDVRDGFLLPSIDMQLRISQKLGKTLRVSGIDKMVRALAKFQQPEPKAQVRAVG
jgi:hypothetical protein